MLIKSLNEDTRSRCQATRSRHWEKFCAENSALRRFFATHLVPFLRSPVSSIHTVSGRSPTPSFVAYTTTDLAQYLTQRYAQHEQLQLVRVQIISWDGRRQLVQFGPLLVTRQADDLHPVAWQAEGKGAYNCIANKFVVLNMGMYYLVRAATRAPGSSCDDGTYTSV